MTTLPNHIISSTPPPLQVQRSQIAFGISDYLTIIYSLDFPFRRWWGIHMIWDHKSGSKFSTKKYSLCLVYRKHRTKRKISDWDGCRPHEPPRAHHWDFHLETKRAIALWRLLLVRLAQHQSMSPIKPVFRTTLNLKITQTIATSGHKLYILLANKRCLIINYGHSNDHTRQIWNSLGSHHSTMSIYVTCSGWNFRSCIVVVLKEALVHALISGAKLWNNKLSFDFLGSLWCCIGRDNYTILAPLQIRDGGPLGSTLERDSTIGFCYLDHGGKGSSNNRRRWGLRRIRYGKGISF